MRVGTSHFVNFEAACKYYRAYYEQEHVEDYVRSKIENGDIHLGRPEIKLGEHLYVIDDYTRYAIDDGKP